MSGQRLVRVNLGKRVATCARSKSSGVVVLAVACFLPACAPAPLVQGVGLSSYAEMTPSDGMVTKSRINVKKERVLAAKTVSIVPAAFPASVAPTLTNEQRALVTNVVNRALCISLSDRFEVVTADQPVDLTVRAVVTQATPTDQVAAGMSAAVNIGMKFVDLGAPVPIPRIPIGLGSLSLEAEAIDPHGQQQAAMLWSRGAMAFFSSPKASKVSDAYDLATAFGDDFGYFLVNGESPFGKAGSGLPSWQKINSTMGFAPKHAACESFGRAPGIAAVVGNQLGLPPEWTDGGERKVTQP
jgi:hypothetical protein